MMSSGRDMTIRGTHDVYLPESMGDARQLASDLAGSGCVPKTLRGNPGGVLAVMMAGARWGMDPLQAIASIHFIEGKPTLDASVLHARCRARADCVFFHLDPERSDETKATFVAKRRGEPAQSVTFGIEDAKRAGSWGRSGPWKQYPRRMMEARAKAALARLVWPEVAAGVYTRDELGEPEREHIDHVDVRPAAERDPGPRPGAVDADFSEVTPDDLRDGILRRVGEVCGGDADSLDAWLTSIERPTLAEMSAEQVDELGEALENGAGKQFASWLSERALASFTGWLTEQPFSADDVNIYTRSTGAGPVIGLSADRLAKLRAHLETAEGARALSAAVSQAQAAAAKGAA